MSRGKKARLEVLSRAAAQLDAVTLDRCWEAALRGDMDRVDQILSPYTSNGKLEKTVGWRDSSSWLFDREAFTR